MSLQNNQPIPAPEKLPNQEEGQVPEAQVTPEAQPVPISPEQPKTEQFSDQQTQNVPIQPIAPPVPAEPPTEPPIPTTPPKIQDDEAPVKKLDETWVEAVDGVIEKDQDKPYEEEEDSETLQKKYLSQRFGKEVPKDETSSK